MLEVAIIGGGLHGVHLAHVLRRQVALGSDQIAIIDPQPTLTARWRTRTARVGFDHLRSTLVHHLGVEAQALVRENEARGGIDGDFAPPYQQPSLSLFNAHLDSIIRDSDLERCHHVGTAIRVQRKGSLYDLETSDGKLTARRVVLALGASELYVPEWATATVGKAIEHVFAPTARPDLLRAPGAKEHVAIVGSGMTAVQLGIRFAKEGCGSVTLLSLRHPSIKQFDSDAGWMGPRFLDDFEATTSLLERRRRVTAGRNRGSITAQVSKALRAAVASEALVHRIGRISTVELGQSSMVVRFDQGDLLIVDRIVLATGFLQSRPGGSLLQDLIESQRLPTAPCGYPVIDEHLEWAPGLYVMGNLAELQLGPAAANIPGARMGADAIASALLAGSAKMSLARSDRAELVSPTS